MIQMFKNPRSALLALGLVSLTSLASQNGSKPKDDLRNPQYNAKTTELSATQKAALQALEQRSVVNVNLCALNTMAREAGGNKASLEDISTGQTTFADAAMAGLFAAEITRNISWRGGVIEGKAYSAISLGELQLAFMGALTRFLSEMPQLGGNPSRGFKTPIWNSLVRVLFERTVPLTPDGILLYPSADPQSYNASKPDAGLEPMQIAVLSDEFRANGRTMSGRLFLVDSKNQLIGPTLRPITRGGYVTADGTVMPFFNLQEELETYANLEAQVFQNGFVLNANPAIGSLYTSIYDENYSLTQCFRLAAYGQNQVPDDLKGRTGAELSRDCFRQSGQKALADTVDLMSNAGVTAARGAAAGFVIGWAVPGIGNAAGAGFGAVTNLLSLIYNSYFRKENISARDIDMLSQWIASYTVSPNVYGEILPERGSWMVTEDGLIRRVAKLASTGTAVLLNSRGKPIECEMSLGINGSGETVKVLER